MTEDFDLEPFKHEALPHVVSTSYYYEWNDQDKTWAKFNAHDPEPPTDLKPGKFDGQIAEVSRTI